TNSADSSSVPPRVFGCVIGVQSGRTVEIFNSFELLYDPSTALSSKRSRSSLMDINESPVYLLLNPSINYAQKDLPLTIYESVAAHLTGIHSVIKMLNSRIRVLHHYLLAMQKDDIPCDNSLLRQGSSLLRRLPTIESEKFRDDFSMEYNDTLLVSYLAMFTNCSRYDV
uniref:EIF3F/CSN6-like C-terminal domain-containing protein n=1 Tax=Solanum tuberosum TaxID=4113 RepID=M1C041_SOLTU